MIFFLGIIFLVLIIIFFDWITNSNKNKFNKKIQFFIVIISSIIGLTLLIAGLYKYSTLFLSVAAWFLRKKFIFDIIMSFFRKKNLNAHKKYNEVLSLSESYELLGVDEDTSIEDIIKSHKELIRKLHPDKGGSSYLSAKVNQARDIILKDRKKS